MGSWSTLVVLWAAGAASPVFAQSDSTASLKPRAKIDTSLGAIVVELNAEKAPITTMNFVDYVEAKFYDGTIFHRVAPKRLIQGGAYLPDLSEKKSGLRPAIVCESYNGLTNDAGTIAMYRVPGEPKSARAQFFINVQKNAPLDKLRDKEGYAVFGKVVEGLEVIEKIRGVKTDVHPKYAGGKSAVVPVEPVTINSIRMATALDRKAAESVAASAKMSDDDKLNALVNRLETEIGAKAVKSTTGLMTIDRVEGRGAFPTVEEAVEITYKGTFVNGTEFDNSNRQSQEPIVTNVATLNAGMREGVSGMREGGKRVLIVPPSLAYGADGIPGRIPPNSTLIFEIELFTIKPPVPKKEVFIDETKP